MGIRQVSTSNRFSIQYGEGCCADTGTNIGISSADVYFIYTTISPSETPTKDPTRYPLEQLIIDNPNYDDVDTKDGQVNDDDEITTTFIEIGLNFENDNNKALIEAKHLIIFILVIVVCALGICVVLSIISVMKSKEKSDDNLQDIGVPNINMRVNSNSENNMEGGETKLKAIPSQPSIQPQNFASTAGQMNEMDISDSEEEIIADITIDDGDEFEVLSDINTTIDIEVASENSCNGSPTPTNVSDMFNTPIPTIEGDGNIIIENEQQK